MSIKIETVKKEQTSKQELIKQLMQLIHDKNTQYNLMVNFIFYPDKIKADALLLDLDIVNMKTLLTCAMQVKSQQAVQIFLKQAFKKYNTSELKNMIGDVLEWSVERGHENIATFLLDKIKNPLEFKEELAEALDTFFCGCGSENIIAKLLDKIDNPKEFEKEINEALIDACKYNYVETASLLIEKLKKIYDKKKLGSKIESLMKFVVKNNNQDILEVLLENVVDPANFDRCCGQVLYFASEYNHISMIHTCFGDRFKNNEGFYKLDKETKNSLIDFFDNQIKKSLIKASGNGSQDIVEWLLDGTKTERYQKEIGESLIKASQCGFKDIVKLLLEAIDREKCQKELEESLIEASKRGFKDIVELFLAEINETECPKAIGEACKVAYKAGHRNIVEAIVAKVKIEKCLTPEEIKKIADDYVGCSLQESKKMLKDALKQHRVELVDLLKLEVGTEVFIECADKVLSAIKGQILFRKVYQYIMIEVLKTKSVEECTPKFFTDRFETTLKDKHEDVIAFLFRRMTELNKSDETLINALTDKKESVVEFLLKACEEKCFQEKAGVILGIASEKGSEIVVRFVLENFGRKLTQDDIGAAIKKAAKEGYINILRIFVE